ANCTCVSSGKEEPAVNFISYSPSRHLRCIADLHPIFSVLFSGSQSRHLRFSIAELHRRRAAPRQRRHRGLHLCWFQWRFME
ncbi:hypothetical protein Dimus_005918, partial [Dionaea muscipula]